MEGTIEEAATAAAAAAAIGGGGGSGSAAGGMPPRLVTCASARTEAKAMASLVKSSIDLLPLLLLGGALMSYQFGVFPLVMDRADVGAVFVVFGLKDDIFANGES